MHSLMTTPLTKVSGITILGNYKDSYKNILNEDALKFLYELHQRFNARRIELLEARAKRQKDIDNGILPDFLPETKNIRESNWTVAPLPADLLDRRVEITGPVDRKMIINALNSGAKIFMADLEDSNSPTWENTIEGQINLKDAVERRISFYHPKKDKHYQLKEKIATMMVRPRGLHLEEKNLLVGEEQMSGSLVDFGLYFFHNAKSLLEKGSGPYFYIPKLESHLEARFFNDVFVFAQQYIGIPQKSIKATVLIETILASFELHEILFELKDHSAGLNCGRWDYIFSFIKKFKKLPAFLLPDRSQITMQVPFMSAYSQLVIQTCHKRGVHAMGGMAAQIPIKNDPKANDLAIEKVRQDKLTEVKNGHDGTWVAHPGLVKVAMDVFDQYMPSKNQIHNKRLDLKVSAADLIEVPKGTITEQGIRLNINVGILYIESWLRGVGAAAIYHLMEDAATAEISRTQIWQWINNNAKTDTGQEITLDYVHQLIPSELEKIQQYVGESAFANGKFKEAIELFVQLISAENYYEFLTLPAYEIL